MAKSIETRRADPLVLFPGSLGDFVCVLPALEGLRATSQTQRIAVAVRGQSLEIALHIPWISHVLSLDRSLFASLFSSSAMMSPDTMQLFSSVPCVVSWFGHTSPEVQAALQQLVPGGSRSFAFFSGQEKLHACLYYLRCLGSTEVRCPSLAVRDEDRTWLDEYWQLNGWRPSARLLVIHPGSGGKKKRWAREGFAHVANWWKTRTNRHVMILLGPAEEGEVEFWQRAGIVESSLSLRQVGVLLSRADLFLGNDSGVSHLAGAMGARGVVLFGPTCPEQWRPLGGSLSVLVNRAYRTATPDAVGVSLEEIPAETVIVELVRAGGIR